MYWRQEKGDSWEKAKGETNKKHFKKLVLAGGVQGALAYDGEIPVGWINFGKRTDFAKLNRAPSFQCDDAEQVWSIPCFYIKTGYRNQGVAKALLDFTLQHLKKKKASVVEAYPVKVKADGQAPSAFIWTGTTSMFEKAGFKAVGKKDGGKQRMRK